MSQEQHGASQRGVVMISHRYHPTFSGSAVQAHRLGRQLERRGWQVQVLTARLRGGGAAQETIDGVAVRRLGILGARRSSLQAFLFNLGSALWLVVAGRAFAVVHIHGVSAFSWMPALSARLLGKRTLVKMTLLGSDDAITIRRRRFGRVARWVFFLADAAVSISAPVSAAYRKSGSPESRLIEMPQAVDTEAFRPASPAERDALRERLGLRGDARYLAFVGALIPRKGADVAIGVLERLADAWPQLQLLMVGPDDSSFHPQAQVAEEESMRLLKQRVVDAGLAERVHYTGLVDDVYDYLRASDVFIFPSRREGFGTVMVEAMAAGLPCVVSSLDGIALQVFESGVNGVVVEGHDPDDYARVIDDILRDDASARGLSRAARARAESHYALEVVARLYERLYLKLLAGEAAASLREEIEPRTAAASSGRRHD